MDFRYDVSTSRERIRVDSIESSGIDNIFDLPSKPSCVTFKGAFLWGDPDPDL